MVEKVPEFSAESAIPWRRQRDSAENSGTLSAIIWLCVQSVSSEIMFPESKNIHSQIDYAFFFFFCCWELVLIRTYLYQ